MNSIQNASDLVASCDDFEIVMKRGIPCYKYHGNSYLAKFKSGWSLESMFLFDRKVEQLKQQIKPTVSSIDEEKKVEISSTSQEVTDLDEHDDCSSKWLEFDVDILPRKKKVKVSKKPLQKPLQRPCKKSQKKLIRTHDNDIKSWENQQTIPVERECNDVGGWDDEMCDACWGKLCEYYEKLEKEWAWLDHPWY